MDNSFFFQFSHKRTPNYNKNSNIDITPVKEKTFVFTGFVHKEITDLLVAPCHNKIKIFLWHIGDSLFSRALD